MRWYRIIVNDLTKIEDCINYFEGELTSAKAEVKIRGVVEKLSSELPGIVENRFNQLQEIEGILEYLNIEAKRVRSITFKKYLEQYNRALSSRDCEKYADGDPNVVNMDILVNHFSILRNQWLGIIKGLDIKGFQINNIIKLRVAGMEDVTL